MTYSYNPIGNMTYNSQVGNYTYGTKPHAVTQAGANTYQYDANGNMTSGAGRTIAYNYDNMPKSISKSGVTTTLVYDYAGQRIKKTVSSVTTVYIGKLYECTSGVCTKYIFGGSQKIASKKQGVVYYYHTDHLGSSSIITNAEGIKVEEIYYYPYGETRIDTGSISVKHKYTSQELDGETGLYNYGARYYDPLLARFISADTIVPEPFNPQSLNRYSYVLNNPIIYIDPSGYGPIVWGEINGGGGSSSGNSITFQNYSYNSSYYYPGYYNYNYNQFRYDPFSESRNNFWDYYGNNSSRSGRSGNVVNPAAGQSGSNFGVGINMPVTVTGGVSNSSPYAQNTRDSINTVGSDPYEQKILAVAATWEDVPYKFGGTTKKGADCVGSLWAIYNDKEVGLYYPHKYNAANFPKYSEFTKTLNPRPGDVVWWKPHVAIYVDEKYVWSARREGFDYGKYPISWFIKQYGLPQYYHYER